MGPGGLPDRHGNSSRHHDIDGATRHLLKDALISRGMTVADELWRNDCRYFRPRDFVFNIDAEQLCVTAQMPAHEHRCALALPIVVFERTHDCHRHFQLPGHILKREPGVFPRLPETHTATRALVRRVILRLHHHLPSFPFCGTRLRRELRDHLLNVSISGCSVAQFFLNL